MKINEALIVHLIATYHSLKLFEVLLLLLIIKLSRYISSSAKKKCQLKKHKCDIKMCQTDKCRIGVHEKYFTEKNEFLKVK